MPLVSMQRMTDPDKRHWARLEKTDRMLAWSDGMERKIESAQRAIVEFATRGPCYLGVSWGKDSVAVAGLLMSTGVSVPIVWIRVEPKENPDCVLVRDAFLSRFPHVDYHEIARHCVREPNGTWSSKGTLESGFGEAAQRFGDRYLTGIRSEESAGRKMREAIHGVMTERTCAPITRWRGVDVFAYLHRAGLPIHPAYGCTLGGQIERERVRVASLGGSRGTEFGRREWEWAYYRQELVALGEDQRVLL